MDHQLISDFPASITATFEPHTLLFRKPSGTSRGILTEKKLWLLRLTANGITGTGECSVIPGLSPDYVTDEQYTGLLQSICANPSRFLENPSLLKDAPSILFGLETAYLDWKSGGTSLLFPSGFTEGQQAIPINGLIWMGTPEYMQEQIDQKLAEGFSCIKMKVGAIGFDKEWQLLKGIRAQYDASQITLRVDANGAFSPTEALPLLQRLADLEIHSIEQPIAVGQLNAMQELCARTPLPIALDEELIGITDSVERMQLLETIRPQYIILKPSLHGGLSGCLEWITLAEQLHIPWWMTSALESNIGLNAIAQFTGTFNPQLPQGLGTGGLYETNFKSPLLISEGKLYYMQYTH